MGLMDIFTSFRIDLIHAMIAFVLMIVLLPIMFKFYFQNKKTVKVRYSSLKNMKSGVQSFKIKIRHLPFFIRVMLITCMLTAFAQPYLEIERENKPEDSHDDKKKDKPIEERKKIKIPTEGISIQLVIDRSGSMGLGSNQGMKYNYIKYNGELMSKFDVVKEISKKFIIGDHKEESKGQKGFSGRWNDLIGVFTFARYPFIACPLTLRHELVIDYINKLEVVGPRESQEEDGTYIGYALERAVLQIIDAKERAQKENSYHVKNSIIILITDGKQAISREEDLADRHKSLLPTEAAKIAAKHGIKVYTIGIMPETIYLENGTALSARQIGLGDFDATEIKKVAEITNGVYFSAQDADALTNIYEEINKIEKSSIPDQKEVDVLIKKEKSMNQKKIEKVQIFSYLLWGALVFLLLEVFLTQYYFRRIP